MRVNIEVFSAIVTNTDDPEKEGRIKAVCYGITGDSVTELPFWIRPKLDWGWFYIPDIGEEIELETITEDDLDSKFLYKSFFEEHEVHWLGKRFESSKGGQQVDEVNETPTVARPVDFAILSKNYGKRRGFYTPRGHVFYFDDTEGDESIVLGWKINSEDGKSAEQSAVLVFSNDGSISLNNKNGTQLSLSTSNNAWYVIDENSNILQTTPEGILAADKFGNVITLKDGQINILSAKDVNITATGNVTAVSGGSSKKVEEKLESDGNYELAADEDVTISCGKAIIDSSETYLSGSSESAIEPLVLGTTWATARATMNGQIGAALGIIAAGFTALAADTGLVLPATPVAMTAAATAATTAATAITTFEGASSTYLSSVSKTK